ncbi:MAG TPA: colanic acid exporter [Sulfurospirillum sp. UBA12182]|nr:MAG TPA: colanic acid exporter [Sulfurospirillum sp. UBA12182]
MSLKQKTISGIGWNSVGNIARQIFQVLSLVIMARLLSPEDFGIFAILMIFVAFFNIFASMGTSQAIIHLDSPSQGILSSIFYFNFVVGLFLFVLLYVLAWPISAFFTNPDLVHYLQWIGLNFIIGALSLVQKVLLEKQMLFKRVVAIETIALALSFFVGITAAFYGYGVYSLIIMTLSGSAILTIGLWFSGHWRPSLSFDFQDIKLIWNYSFNLTSFSFINYFARSADQFLIGKFIGASSLGMYSLAYKIMLYPLDNISRVIVRVLFPAFSEIKHDNIRFKNAYIKAISFIALVTFPLMMGLLATANTFVAVAFGDKWIGMAALLMILAPIGMMQSIVTTVGSIYMAKGSTGLMFKIGAVNAVVTVLSFIIGLPYGVEGVAIAYALANLIMLYPNLKISWDQMELGVWEGLHKLWPYFLSAVVMAGMVYYAGAGLESVELSIYAILPLQILLGVLIYIGLLMIFYRHDTISLIQELKKRKS